MMGNINVTTKSHTLLESFFCLCKEYIYVLNVIKNSPNTIPTLAFIYLRLKLENNKSRKQNFENIQS